MLQISEIFASIQGESTMAGLPSAMVRLTGCNLRCGYCDTRHAWEGGRQMSVQEIMVAVEKFGLPLVEITGGEPLMQPDVHELISRLLESGYRVMVETNGSRPISELDPRVLVVMDVKTPGSGESGSMDFSNFDYLKREDNVKFVITSRSDYVWARDLMYKFELHEKAAVLFSAAFGEIDYKSLAEWMVSDRLPARLQLQLHKYIWSPDSIGV